VASESIGNEQLALGIRRTAKLMDTSESTIRRAIRRGELKVIRLSRRVLIPYESIRSLLEKE
jgi:excisionase family DNA binding protein